MELPAKQHCQFVVLSYFFNSPLILNFADDWEGPGPDGNFEEDGGGPVPMHLVSPDNVKEWLVTLVFFVKSRNTLSRFIVLTSFLF